jgi:hypothetical protein
MTMHRRELLESLVLASGTPSLGAVTGCASMGGARRR